MLAMQSSTISTKKLLGGAVLGALAVVLLLLAGMLLPMERNSVKFSLQSTADAPQEYTELSESGEAVPANTGRFQLSRILQQLQIRSGSAFRLLTLREVFRAIQTWHCLLLLGFFCGSFFLRSIARVRLLFHLYLNAITPCRAGPFCALF